jgi:hypothetical protein
MKLKKFFFMGALALLFLTAILFLILKADYGNNVPQKKDIPGTQTFDLKSRLKQKPGIEITEAFPVKDYLDSSNYENINLILTDLMMMDSLNNDESANRRLLSEVLTSKLFVKDSLRLAQGGIDSLFAVLQWAEKFAACSEIDGQNRIVFKSIAAYWLTYISNKLAKISAEQPSVKYKFRFRYLLARCDEMKFTTGVKITEMEKVVDNLTRNKWAHLINATWNQTSLLQKIFFLVVILATLYGYYLIALKILKK